MKKIYRRFGYALFALVVAAFFALRHAPVIHEKSAAIHLPPVNREHKMSLTYDVYAAGFSSLNASLTIDVSRKDYDVTLEAETKGLIGKLFSWKTDAHATGRIDEKSALIPALYTQHSIWHKNVSATEMSYDPHGSALKMTTQDNGKASLDTDMNTTLANHAGDVLTGTLALLRNAGSASKCTGKVPVFDGKRRFNIILTDDGTEVLAPSRYSGFTGKTMRCIFKMEPVAGFEPNDQKRGWMAIQNYTEEHHKLPTIWLSRIKNSEQVIPVRVEITSAYGSVVANLSGSTGN